MSARANILRAGLAWLYDTEQPGDAVLQHHGLGVPGGTVDNRSFTFVPVGWRRHVVVVVNVVKVEWGEQYGEGPRNPLGRDELTEITAELARLGAEVVTTWNGHPGVTGSLALSRPAHPTLGVAVDRYLKGCPTHLTTLCGSGWSCTWYSDGFAKVVRPSAVVGGAA